MDIDWELITKDLTPLRPVIIAIDQYDGQDLSRTVCGFSPSSGVKIENRVLVVSTDEKRIERIHISAVVAIGITDVESGWETVSWFRDQSGNLRRSENKFAPLNLRAR